MPFGVPASGREGCMTEKHVPQEVIHRFRSVSLERLERLEAAWGALKRGEGAEDAARELEHDLHTLKGDSRVVGFGEVALLCHKLEELFLAAARQDYCVAENLDLVVTMALRFIAMLLRMKDGTSIGGIDVGGFVVQIDQVLAEVPPRSSSGPASRSTRPPPSVSVAVPDRVSPGTQQRLASAATDVFLEHLSATGPARARLKAIWQALRYEIATFCAVPLGPRLLRHESAVLSLASDLGKTVSIHMDLGNVQVRSEVAEALDTAVLHALRNAVDHGIEEPTLRQARGKPQTGRIVVSTQSSSDMVEIMIEEDGGGIDIEAVRRRAVEMGYLSSDRAPAACEAEILEILLLPGFTTRTHVTEVSGRGIGLDAVRTALARAGGKISLSTRPGQGTTSVVRVPQARQSLRVHLFRAWKRELSLAVETTYSLVEEAQNGPLPFDPLSVLAIAPSPAGGLHAGEPFVLTFQRGDYPVAVVAAERPVVVTGERACPTGRDYPVEVLVANGTEALLLRLDVLYEMMGNDTGLTF
jgi:two-component system chemotaxis sensor kinase CheA